MPPFALPYFVSVALYLNLTLPDEVLASVCIHESKFICNMPTLSDNSAVIKMRLIQRPNLFTYLFT